MLFFYRIGLHVFALALRIGSYFFSSAKDLKDGHKNTWKKLQQLPQKTKPRLWLHAASLGEFEQGLPVIASLNKNNQWEIIITFFSASGYKLISKKRSDYQIFYLPLDSLTNAKNFVTQLQPNLCFFVKYEIWYFYYQELSKQKIPHYLISAVFQKDHWMGKWYGKFMLSALRNVNHIFTQDENSLNWLKQNNLYNISLAGDTRFDRVKINSENTYSNNEIESFINKMPCMVFGSIWQIEWTFIKYVLTKHKIIKLIVAPHKLSDIPLLQNYFQDYKPNLFSDNSYDNDSNLLLVDTIGHLSSLYRYANIAFVGGGFTGKLHNVLEAAVYNIPVVTGPKINLFNEALNMQKQKILFTVEKEDDLDTALLLLEEKDLLQSKISQFMQANLGATEKIVQYVNKAYWA